MQEKNANENDHDTNRTDYSREKSGHDLMFACTPPGGGRKHPKTISLDFLSHLLTVTSAHTSLSQRITLHYLLGCLICISKYPSSLNQSATWLVEMKSVPLFSLF